MEPEPLYQEDRQRIEEREAYITAHPEESEHPPEPEEPVELTVEVPRSPSCWRKTQNKVSCVVNSSIFETFITLCILLNTLAMALEHYKMDKVFSKVLENCNLVSDSFLCIFQSFLMAFSGCVERRRTVKKCSLLIRTSNQRDGKESYRNNREYN